MSPARRSRGPQATVPPEDYLAFCDAARRFVALRPWDTMQEQPVAILFPGEAEPDFAVAMGTAGEFVGMALLRGLAGLAWVRLGEAGASDDDLRESLDDVAFSMGPASDLEPWDRAQRRAAGMRARRGEAMPSVIAKHPGVADTAPTPEDLGRLTRAAQAFAEAYAAGAIGPTEREDERLRTLLLPERAGQRVRVETRTYAPAPWIEAAPVAPPEALRAVRRGRARWIAAARRIPATVRGDDRVLRTLLVLDEASGMILANRILVGIAPEDAAREFWQVLAAIGAAELPARVTIANRRLWESVGGGLRGLGVEVRYDPDHEGVREVFHALIGFLGGGR